MVRSTNYRATLAVSWALLQLPGCKPDLREGVYGCETDSTCPDSWTCRSDHLCYATPGTIDGSAGAPGSGGEEGTGGSAPSGGSPPEDLGELHEECTDESNCASGSCLPSQDPAVNTGVCTIGCFVDGDCNAETFGVTGYCTNGQCIQSCEGPQDCPTPQGCWELTDRSGPGRHVCFETLDAPEPGLSCGPSVGACPWPTSCLIASAAPTGGGVCGQECEEDMDCAPTDQSCLQLFTSQKVCMTSCTDTEADCAGQNQCVTLGTEGTFCAPADWDGLDLPLTEHGPLM